MNYIFVAVLRFWHHGNNVTKDIVSWLIKSQEYDYSRETVFYMSMANFFHEKQWSMLTEKIYLGYTIAFDTLYICFCLVPH